MPHRQRRRQSAATEQTQAELLDRIRELTLENERLRAITGETNIQNITAPSPTNLNTPGQAKGGRRGCSCKGICTTRLCGCVKRNLACNEFCKCSDEQCQNQDENKENADRPNDEQDTTRGANATVARSMFSPEPNNAVPNAAAQEAVTSPLKFGEGTPVQRPQRGKRGPKKQASKQRQKENEDATTENAAGSVENGAVGKKNPGVAKNGKTRRKSLSELLATRRDPSPDAYNPNQEAAFNPMASRPKLSRSPLATRTQTQSIDHPDQSLQPDQRNLNMPSTSGTSPIPVVDVPEDVKPLPDELEQAIVDWDQHKAQLMECKKCGRHFYAHRIEKHQAACIKI